MNLDEIRRNIDRIDHLIVKLLNDRTELALRTRRAKKEVSDPAREQQVIHSVLEHARDYPVSLVPAAFLENLFQQLIQHAKDLQQINKQLIGFQGSHGSFSDAAASLYDASLVTIGCLSFAEVFRGVESKALDLGIVPVENSLEGVVTQVNDLLATCELHIVAEVCMRVHHCFLTLPEQEAHTIRVVYSHSQALAQCRTFIEDRNLQARSASDTASAAKLLAERRPAASGVLANERCARIYNLKTVAQNVEDHASNETRFVVLSKTPSGRPGDKCSIVFTAHHEVGALHKVLQIFAEAGIDLTRIASRPIRDQPRHFSFFLDFLGNANDSHVQQTLQKVRDQTIALRLLGCYPQWADRL